MNCTHCLWLYSCLFSLIDRSIASIQETPHITHTTHRQMLSSEHPFSYSKFWNILQLHFGNNRAHFTKQTISFFKFYFTVWYYTHKVCFMTVPLKLMKNLLGRSYEVSKMKKCHFLAATSSSRSDVVNQCIRLSKDFFLSLKSFNGV